MANGRGPQFNTDRIISVLDIHISSLRSIAPPGLKLYRYICRPRSRFIYGTRDFLIETGYKGSVNVAIGTIFLVKLV